MISAAEAVGKPAASREELSPIADDCLNDVAGAWMREGLKSIQVQISQHFPIGNSCCSEGRILG
jgi:hypothetical protein